MIYLSQSDIGELGISWNEVINVIEKATGILQYPDEFSQPLKPYLRYKNLKNRIIAMPAYLGGSFEVAGIKWIASYPGNVKKGIPRAHSVILLNNSDTGKPEAILNTSLISGIRTAAVSGMFTRAYLNNFFFKVGTVNFGIIGFGPIGQLHLKMICESFFDFIGHIYIYDVCPIATDLIPYGFRDRVIMCNRWEDVYNNSGVFITCTVSDKRYINHQPPKPSLHINVSLRDYFPEFLKYVDLMIVDNWEEVCRENTDIELMNIEFGLKEENVYKINDIVSKSIFDNVKNKIVMFNPMGMGVYDMAIAKYYYNLSIERNIGINLPD